MLYKCLLVQIHSSDLFLSGFYLLCWLKKKKISFMAPLFIDGIQLPRGYRATTRGHFTFYHQVNIDYKFSEKCDV